MPYQTNKDLPEQVARVLPDHAQEIYREAFNSAWKEYKNPVTRRESSSQEETAHKVAWAADKNKYYKKGEKWVAKEN